MEMAEPRKSRCPIKTLFVVDGGRDQAGSLPRSSKRNIKPGACATLRAADPASFPAALASPWQPQGQAKFLCLFKRTACYPRAPSRACRGLNHHGNSKSSQLALRTLRGSSVMAPPLPAPRASFTMATEYGLLGLGLSSPQRREGSAKGCGCGEILASRREVPEVLVAGCISSPG